MTRRIRVLAAVALLVPASLLGGETPRFRVRVDVSKTPAAVAYVEPVKALCEEWYPKINGALFGKEYPLPFEEVRVVFEPKIEKGTGAERVEAGGFSDKNTIWLNFSYVERMKDDYRAMFVHELTHVNQHYKEVLGIGWLVEGMADYVRHKYFERDIEPHLLELDGYHVDQVKLRRQGYQFGYTIASPFLDWLQTRKDQNIIISLNRALREGSYSPAIFEQRCGASLDDLWREFISQNR